MTIANSIRSESHWWQIANLKVSSRSSNNLIESQCQAFFVPRHSLLLIQLTVLLSKIFNRILRQSPDCPKEMTALRTHFSPRYNYVFYIAVRRLSKLVTSLRNLHWWKLSRWMSHDKLNIISRCHVDCVIHSCVNPVLLEIFEHFHIMSP